MRDALSALFLPSSASDLSSSDLRTLPPLPDLLALGSSAIEGGDGDPLGGTDRVPCAGVEFLLAALSCGASAGSGVNGEAGLLISSRLPTASLLCTLLNAGYEAAGRASPLVLRSISGTNEVFLESRSLVAERGESRPRSRSLLPDLRLWTFKLVLELAFSRLRSDRSLSLEVLESCSRSYCFLLRRRGFSSSSKDGIVRREHSSGHGRRMLRLADRG